MGNGICSTATILLEKVGYLTRKSLFRVLSVGPIPAHIAFIMDGNRRYSKKMNLEEGAGHKAGYSALMSMLQYCYELGVKYVTIYAFSIENFKRRPEEVQTLMDLLQEKIELLQAQESIINQYGLRVHFVGNLTLLTEPVRTAARKVMDSSAKNTNGFLLICVAYTSRDEIMHAVQESCRSKMEEIEHRVTEPVEERQKTNGSIFRPDIKLADIERRMYMAVAPDPDILIRSSGETRLSNFLLWQTCRCPLYSPAPLWPEIGLRHLVWAVLDFQRCYSDLQKKMKQI